MAAAVESGCLDRDDGTGNGLQRPATAGLSDDAIVNMLSKHPERLLKRALALRRLSNNDGEATNGRGEQKSEGVELVEEAANADEEVNTHTSSAAVETEVRTMHRRVMQPAHSGQFLVHPDLQAVEAGSAEFAPNENCRWVMALFRANTWASFVWYAIRHEEAIKALHETFPKWRTRLLVDDSVPPKFVQHLMEKYNVEVVYVLHKRKRTRRDSLLACLRLVTFDDLTVDRYCSLDGHDNISDPKVLKYLRENYVEESLTHRLNFMTTSVGCDGEAGYCYLNGGYYGEDPKDLDRQPRAAFGDDDTHRHADMGMSGSVGGHGRWRLQGKTPIMDCLLATTLDVEAEYGIDEAIQDITLGSLMRRKAPYVNLVEGLDSGAKGARMCSDKRIESFKQKFGLPESGYLGWRTGRDYLSQLKATKGEAKPTVLDLRMLGCGEVASELCWAYGDCWDFNPFTVFCELCESTFKKDFWPHVTCDCCGKIFAHEECLDKRKRNASADHCRACGKGATSKRKLETCLRAQRPERACRSRQEPNAR